MTLAFTPSESPPPHMPTLPPPPLVEPPPPPIPGFFAGLPRDLLYPFRGAGLYRYFTGSTLVWFGLAASSLLGGQSIMLSGPILGYLAVFLIAVANASGDGRYDVPEFPKFRPELVSEFAMLNLTITISMLPILVYGLAIVFLRAPIELMILAIYASGFFLPMALIRVCMLQTIEGVKPVPVFQSIARVLTPYIGLCLVLSTIQFVQNILRPLCALVPYAGVFLKAMVIFYFLILQMRLFGTFYYTYRRTLGWFEHIV